MLSKQEFINQSLKLNLFFLRIMKEHAIFLEAALPLKNKDLISQADAFKNEFTTLLSHAISLSDGVLSSKSLEANELITKYTIDAEKVTQFATGIFIDSHITSMQHSLSFSAADKNITMLTDNVYMLNHHSIAATNMIIKFKSKLKNDVLSCRLFTNAYPSLLDHVLRESIIFVELLTRLQNGTNLYTKRDILNLENFWNEKMSEHSFFIRGLLDPTEMELFNISDNFGKEFETLRKEASIMNSSSSDLPKLTDITLKETIKLREFKAQGTEGILACKIKSLILPLLSDHVLREANYYINLLESFNNM